MNSVLLICAGGFLGAISRYLLGIYITGLWKGDFPLGTFIINVLGSFFLGLIIFQPQLSTALGSDLKLGIGVGFLGSFTTFSTFEYETLQLLEKKKRATALAYVLLSLLAGITAAWLTRLF